MKKLLALLTVVAVGAFMLLSCGEERTEPTQPPAIQSSQIDTPNTGDSGENSDTGSSIGWENGESDTSAAPDSTTQDSYGDSSTGESLDGDDSETDATVDSSIETDDSETDETVDSSIETDDSETDASIDSDLGTDDSVTDETTDIPLQSGTDNSSDIEDIPPDDEDRVDYFDFEMTDMDGNVIRLSQLLDKPVVLNFWASWCPPCRAEMPDFEEAYNRHGEYINFVMVSVDYTFGEAKSFFEGSGYTFPAYFDYAEDGGDKYNISVIPQTFFITTDGEIVYHCPQLIYKEQLEEEIERLKALHGITEKPAVPDVPIDIAKDGESNYVIVYDDTDVRVSEFAQKIAEYLKTEKGISLDTVPQSQGTDSEYCIYIGDVKGTFRVKKKLNKSMDFAACVSGNSFVMYATDTRSYEYLYELFTTKIVPPIKEGDWSADPKDAFIYSQSEYKDTSYVDYLINKNGGEFTYELMLKLFEARSFTATDGTTLKYRIYIPYGYSVDEELPVLTILHGAGERGNNNTDQMKNMVFSLFSNRENPVWDSIVVCPQCPSWPEQWVDTPWAEGSYSVNEVAESNEAKAVLEILDYVKGSLKTDEDRYYITGLSMGGFGTWDLIMRHTELFAGAVPICGGADPTQAEKLVNMPIYTFHGTSDTSVPFLGTKEMVDAILSLGGEKLKHKYFPGAGHIIWENVGKDLSVWEWLFSQIR